MTIERLDPRYWRPRLPHRCSDAIVGRVQKSGPAGARGCLLSRARWPDRRPGACPSCGRRVPTQGLGSLLLSPAIALLVIFAVPERNSAARAEPSALLVLATDPSNPPQSSAALSPAEKMQRRYPQPVKVGDLIGLRVLDDEDRTLGRVQSVVRTARGKIVLIVPYGGFLGWRQRLVAVPIEVVAIAGRQLAALDMQRAEFAAAPAWNDRESQAIPASEIIRIGLYRR